MASRARRKVVARQHSAGSGSGTDCGKIFQAPIDNPPHHARADAADGFVDRNDAADLGGVRRLRRLRAEQLVLRIDHLDPAGPRIELRLAVHHNLLPLANASFQITAVKEFARQRPGLVSNQ